MSQTPLLGPAKPPLAPHRHLHLRLSALLFLQFAVLGAFVPLLSVHLNRLGLTELELAGVFATPAMAALVSPLVMGQVADRWLPAERCITVCALAASGLLWLLAGLRDPPAVFAVSLAAWLVLQPALNLGTTVSLTHLSNPERQYSLVRLWGTVGWIVPGLLLFVWFSDLRWLCRPLAWFRPENPQSELSDTLRLAALLAFVHGSYALTLPHTPPQRRAAAWLAPVAAARLLRDRSFAVYFVCVLGAWASIPFSSQAVPLLLEALQVPLRCLSPTLTIAQAMEVIALALLPMLLLRFGVRGTMLLGLAAWVTALTVLATGPPVWLAAASLLLNGLFISFFAVAGQVFVNRKARGDIRASAQALLAFTAGAGMLGGNLVVGLVRRAVQGAFAPTFAVGAGIAAALVVVFLIGFRDDQTA